MMIKCNDEIAEWASVYFECSNMNRIEISFLSEYGFLNGTITSATYVRLSGCIFTGDCMFTDIIDIEISASSFFADDTTSPFTSVGCLILNSSPDDEEEEEENDTNQDNFSTWCLTQEIFGFAKLKTYKDTWSALMITHLIQHGVEVEYFEE